MTYLFQLFVCLLLIVLRSVILSAFPLFDNLYDLMIVYVIFTGLNNPLLPGILLVAIAGLLMDSVSGGGFGVFLVTYLWLFAAVRWLTRFMHARSFILLSVVLFAGVFLEKNIQLTIMFSRGENIFTGEISHTILGEFAWVLFTGHLMFMVLRWANSAWDIFSARVSARLRSSAGR